MIIQQMELMMWKKKKETKENEDVVNENDVNEEDDNDELDGDDNDVDELDGDDHDVDEELKETNENEDVVNENDVNEEDDNDELDGDDNDDGHEVEGDDNDTNGELIENFGKIISRTRKIKHLVVDTAAFIKNIPLQNFSDDIYTIPDVIMEVRDSNAREFLDTFPFPIKQLNPSESDYAIVAEFSRKTGDYSSLSKTDLKILALTYMLTVKENKDKVRINPIPKKPEEKKRKT